MCFNCRGDYCVLSDAENILSSRITVAICVSMVGVGDNRILLSGETEILAISDILCSPSFHLEGATVLIFSTVSISTIVLIWDIFTITFDPEAGFPLVPSFIYRS